MGILVDKSRKTKVRLNRLFLGSMLLIEILLLSLVASTAFQFVVGDITIFSFVAVSIILIWLGLLIGYYAWGIYFYNINLGLTNESWAELKEKRKSEEDLECFKTTKATETEANSADNVYRAQSLGLPPGTIRGTLALTLMVAALSLFIYSMGDPDIQEGNSFIYDSFEFLKTAFLMMIAFYFGTKSLEILRKNTAGGIIQKPFSGTNLQGANLKGDTPGVQPTGKVAPVQPDQEKPQATTGELNEVKVSTTEMSIPKEVSDGNALVHKTLGDDDIKKQSEAIGVEPAAMKAVIKVESGGSGFLASGRPKILFEGHIFWRHLEEKKKNGQVTEGPEYYAVSNPDIVYKSWTRNFYLGGEKEYTRLEKAMLIDRDSAYMAASWGKFQILGENFKLAGFKSVVDFVEAHKISELEHLKAFVSFISNTSYKSRKLVDYLQDKDWASFARAYNGPAYSKNQYDLKLEQAYDEYFGKMNTGFTATLKRKESDDKQTLGELSISEKGVTVLDCKTLELPWKNNQRNVSCIPVGTYQVLKRTSEKYGKHFHLQNVPDRSMILIHSGNYYTQTQGCILVGSGYEDINQDGITDVKESRLTLQKLYATMPDQFDLTIS